jgi:nitrite reductase (NADH) small subunit
MKMRTYEIGLKRNYLEKSITILKLGKLSVGICRFKGKFYAYQNVCAHQGGPACEGGIFGNTECEIRADGSRSQEYTSQKRVNIACPWHGVEYDIETGICRANPSMRLQSFKIRVDNLGKVKITL